MSLLSDGSYARKMRKLALGGADVEVDVRFVDMLSPRGATVLDVGCGIGSAVKGLRDRGHQAFGIDVEQSVLDVANELYDGQWFRRLDATQLTAVQLRALGLPCSFDVVLLDGNVPAFLTTDGLRTCMAQVHGLLDSNGVLITGTTSKRQGGPVEQDQAAELAGLTLINRFSDWHLAPYSAESSWCVSVYALSSSRRIVESPGGIFVLPPTT